MNDLNDKPTEQNDQALECTTSTALVEVAPGVAVVFGEVPDGLDLIGLDMIPAFDRTELSQALGALGNAGTIAGNVASAVSQAQGLFRVNDATLTLLKTGGEMAAKDGFKLGTIFKNGEMVAQARFIPHSITAATAIAAIGPAIAMIALQMQLDTVAKLMNSNKQLTKNMLSAVRNEQWAEFEGLADSVDRACLEVSELGDITESVWEPIAPSISAIRKQRDLYEHNLRDHIQALQTSKGSARREYLHNHAEAIIVDTRNLIGSLWTYAQYQNLRSFLARKRSVNNQEEAKLFQKITREIPAEITALLAEIRQLVTALVRELQLIAEVPDSTSWLPMRNKDAKVSQETCKQLLTAIQPWVDLLHITPERPVVPEHTCAPTTLDLDPYLRILRWLLADDETLRSVAFPCEVETPQSVYKVQLAKSWDMLTSGTFNKMVGKLISKQIKFVAVTDRQIITADPTMFLQQGIFESSYPLTDVKYVRLREESKENVRPTLDVITEQRDIHWMFPEAARQEDIDNLAAVLFNKPSEPRAIEQSIPLADATDFG